jgi:hypothetical protein
MFTDIALLQALDISNLSILSYPILSYPYPIPILSLSYPYPIPILSYPILSIYLSNVLTNSMELSTAREAGQGI